MGVFGPGLLLDDRTGRPIAGRILSVYETGTKLPTTTYDPDDETTPIVVSTNANGYYGQFSVPNAWSVLISTGSADEVVAAIDRRGTSVTVTASVDTEAELPAVGEAGDAYLVRDTGDFWFWDTATWEWVNGGSIKVETNPAAAAVNILNHGVTGDGVTDDTAAINAALAAASEGARIFFPRGNYRTTDTIVVDNNVSLDMDGVLRPVHSGTAIRFKDLGRGTNYNGTHRVSARKNVLDHSGGSVGVEVSGCYNQSFDIRHVSQFDTGLRLGADLGKGCVYNTFHLGALADNRVQIHLDGVENGPTDAEKSWPNQNTFIGGRISWGAVGANRVGYVGVKVGSSGGYLPNGNLFLNPSIEDVGVSGAYALPVEVYGHSNTFISTRMEGGLNPTFRTGSWGNRWFGGFYGGMDTIVDQGIENTFDTTPGGKHWATTASPRTFSGSGTSGAAMVVYNSSSENSDAIRFMASDGTTTRSSITAAGRHIVNGIVHVHGIFNVPPTSGTWKRGSIVWNIYPSAGGTLGWVCVADGTPGTWKALGGIAA